MTRGCRRAPGPAAAVAPVYIGCDDTPLPLHELYADLARHRRARATHRARARQRGQQETQQRAGAPAACAGRTRGPAMRRCWPKATRLSPRARHARRPLIQRRQAHAWFVPHRIMARDEPGYWRLVPSRARAMPPTDPIAAVTHADPYPYYAALARASAVPRRHAEPMGRQQSAAIAQVLAHPAARVRPPPNPCRAACAPAPPRAVRPLCPDE